MLSDLICVVPWMKLISCSSLQRGASSFILMKPDPVSDSLTEEITVLMIFLLNRTGTLSFGGGSVGLIGSLGLSES